MNRTFVSLGAFLAGVGVALGAFGTHALREKLAERLLETWQTAVQYHTLHALALVVVGLICAHRDTKLIRSVGWLFAVGILIFGGTLYAYALTETKAFAIVTPLGGLCFIVGWFLLAFAVARPVKSKIGPKG